MGKRPKSIPKLSHLKGPIQLVIGGVKAQKLWNAWYVPILRSEFSSRDIALMVGVSHNTIALYRKHLKNNG